MKAHIFRLLGAGAVLVLMASTVQPAQAQLGVAAGLNFDDFGDIEFQDTDASLENATGWHIGLFYDLAFGPLGLRPGVFYRSAGEVTYDLGAIGEEVEAFDLSLIEVPVDLRYRLTLPFVQPYLMAGPVFSFASSDDSAFDESLEDFTVAGNVGLGVEISPPGFSLTFYPEIRYQFGLNSFVDDYEFLRVDVTPLEDDQRLNAFMLRLGVSF